jgi:hypothetical protein
MACSRAPVTSAGKVSALREQPRIDAAHKTQVARVPTFIALLPEGVAATVDGLSRVGGLEPGPRTKVNNTDRSRA